ncbi:MAG: hypothetical protein E6R03_11655 [Hyphomicrobiaceae bacterium]|nr:MAG: hypothetical protein E6R03_11655 [Hyphomicrobiaceae bacterium]
MGLRRQTGEITTNELTVAFRCTNFGTADHRKLLAHSVLKVLAGYECGSTITVIMRNLDLITKSGTVTAKGRMFLWKHFGSTQDAG